MKSLKTNAVMNVIRQSCSILFPLITFPYVSRILGAENYGKVNFAASIVSYISLIGAMGISNYAIREGARLKGNKSDLNEFANEIFSINFLSTIFAYFIMAAVLFFWNKLHNYCGLILILGVQVFFTMIGVDWLISIEEDYIYTTIRQICIQIISLFSLFIFTKEENDYYIYAVITVFSSSANSVLNFFRAKKYVNLKLVFHSKLQRHLKPIAILFACTIGGTIYINSDVTILGLLKDDYEVGIYSVATKIYNIVKQLINALMVVCVPRLSYYLGEKNCIKYKVLLDKMLNVCIMVVLPAMVGLFFMSRDIVLLFAGEKYYEGYVPLQLLSIALCFAIMAGFYTTQIMIPNKQDRQLMFITLFSAGLNIILNILIVPYMGAKGAALTTIFAEMAVAAGGIFCTHKIFVPRIEKMQILSYAVGCGVICIVCSVGKIVINDLLLRLFSCVFASVFLYAGILIVSKNPMMKGWLSNMNTFLRKRVEK